MERTLKNEIEKLMKEIGNYRQAIEDAEGALAEAERELDDALAQALEEETAAGRIAPDIPEQE